MEAEKQRALLRDQSTKTPQVGRESMKDRQRNNFFLNHPPALLKNLRDFFFNSRECFFVFCINIVKLNRVFVILARSVWLALAEIPNAEDTVRGSPRGDGSNKRGARLFVSAWPGIDRAELAA